MKSGFGTGLATVPVKTRAAGVRGLLPWKCVGFFALNRLNTSPNTSRPARPPSANRLPARRFIWLNDAPRPQLTVSHGPISSNDGLPWSSTPVNLNAVVWRSLVTPSLLRSTPDQIFIGSAERYRKIGETVMPHGA